MLCAPEGEDWVRYMYRRVWKKAINPHRDFRKLHRSTMTPRSSISGLLSHLVPARRGPPVGEVAALLKLMWRVEIAIVIYVPLCISTRYRSSLHVREALQEGEASKRCQEVHDAGVAQLHLDVRALDGQLTGGEPSDPPPHACARGRCHYCTRNHSLYLLSIHRNSDICLLLPSHRSLSLLLLLFLEAIAVSSIAASPLPRAVKHPPLPTAWPSPCQTSISTHASTQHHNTTHSKQHTLPQHTCASLVRSSPHFVKRLRFRAHASWHQRFDGGLGRSR